MYITKLFQERAKYRTKNRTKLKKDVIRLNVVVNLSDKHLSFFLQIAVS